MFFSILAITTVIQLFGISSGQTDSSADSTQSSVTASFDEDLIFWALKRRQFFLHKTTAYYTNPKRESLEITDLQKNALFESVWNGEIWSMAADYHARRLYYTDHTGNFIGVYNLKSKEHIKTFQGMAWGIDSLSVDWISGNVYWADSNFNWIMVANRNFSYYRNIVNIESDIPAKVAVHPPERYLYWSEKRKTECLIWRSDLAGYHHELLHTFPEVQTITDLTIDFVNDRLYWAESLRATGSVSRIRYFDFYDIDLVHEVYSMNSSYFFGLTSYKEHLYVTDDLRKSLFIVNKDTKNVVSTHSFLYSDTPRGVAVFSPHEQPFSDEDKAHECSKGPCHHICLASPGLNQYECECGMGFRIQPDGRNCKAGMVEDDFAIVLDSKHSKLYQINLANQLDAQEIQVSGLSMPSAAVYDPTNKMVYWADEKSRQISRASLYGVGQKVLVNNAQVYSIALDVGSDNMYWVDSERDALYVSRLNGSFPRILIVKDMTRVWAMTIDTKRGYLYWSDWGKTSNNGSQHGVIESARLDGSERSVIIEAGATPHGLTLDSERNILFWTQIRTNQLGWYNLNDRKSGKYIMPANERKPFLVGIAYYNDHLYLTDMASKYLLRVSVNEVMSPSYLSGIKVRTFGAGMFYQLAGISVYDSGSWHSGSTACADSKCPHLCLPIYSSNSDTVGYRCECQNHFNYFQSNNSCVQMSSTADDKPPTFGGTCPSSMRVYAEACSNDAVVEFTVPSATDNSGHPVHIKSATTGKPPYILGEGRYQYSYTAIDSSGNVAVCRFSVEVAVRTCYDWGLADLPSGAVLGEKSCGDNIGSVINVTCPGLPKPAFQFECKSNFEWTTIGQPTCTVSTAPPATTRTTTTTKAAATTHKIHDITSHTRIPTTPQQSKLTKSTVAANTGPSDALANSLKASQTNSTNLTIGLVIAILILIIVIIVAAFAFYRRHKGRPFIPGSKWRRVEDRVHLTGASTESGIYIGDQHEVTSPFASGELTALSAPEKRVV